MRVTEFLIILVLITMLSTLGWFLNLPSHKKYPTPNRILWNVLGFGFAIFMILVLIHVIWIE